MPVLAYCATLNNYSEDDVATLRTPNSRLKYIIVGHEVGESGTPHLQIYFQLEKQTKLTTIKNWGGPFARMHFEAARGTDVQASDYCKKEGNYFELGSRTPMGKKGARNDLEELQKSIREGKSYEEICEEHFDKAAKYHKFIRERIQAQVMEAELSSLHEVFSSASLKPWQRALLDVVDEPVNPRKIHWIWEDQGNVGKSWMAKYLMAERGAVLLTPGKKADMAYIFSKNPSKIVIFDLSRTTAPTDGKEHYLDGVYSLAEDLKNGMVTSYKYDSTNVLTTGSHVIFFANFAPDMTKWSQDRYLITRL